MANPQKENGYTPIANEILEKISQLPLNGSQYRILLIIWRFTYGFSRKEHELSLTFISTATNIHKQQVKRELDTLIEKKVITVIREAYFNTTRKIEFNKNYDEWVVDSKQNSIQSANPLTGSESVDSQSANPLTQQSANPLTKKTNIKTISKTKEKFFENENLEATFQEFIKMRNKIKKPMTDHAIDLMITKLNKMATDDETRIALLNQSIENSWQTIYELKNAGQSKPQQVDRYRKGG